jgi:hypothetical protein
MARWLDGRMGERSRDADREGLIGRLGHQEPQQDRADMPWLWDAADLRLIGSIRLGFFL